MKIAVVIPAYNAHRFLAETIQSVIGQTWKDWELILVDDGSTDNTALIGAEWAERDQRIRVVAKSNAGVSVARNRGIAEISADTEYVAFLDADDLWEPDALESLAGALAANPRAVAAHGLHRRIDTGGELQRTDGEPPYEHTRHAIQDHRLVPLPISSPTTFEALVFKNYIMTGTILIRRRILQEIEHFDPKITHGEDWDLWLRLSMLGDIALVDRNILRYRQHGEGASSNRRNIYLGERQVRQKLMSAPGLAPAQRHLLYVGYRWSEWARSCSMLRWAGENVRQGNLPGAARQLRHAALGYIHYLKPG